MAVIRKRDDIVFFVCVLVVIIAILFSFGAGEKYPYPEEGKSGSYYRIKNLQIDDYIATEVRSVGSGSWPLLESSSIKTQAGSTNYNQYIKFNETGSDAIPGGQIVYEENDNDEISDYLKFKKGREMFEYEIDFAEGFESEISENDLKDIDGESINILGEDYEIIEAKRRNNKITMKLYGGSVPDTLKEKETKAYNVNGKIYTVQPLIVSTKGTRDVVKFLVNGEVTESLEEEDSHMLLEGTLIGVKEIIPNEAKEKEGDDIVEFFVGSKIIWINDADFTDDNFDSGGLEINGNTVNEGSIRVKAFLKGNDTLIVQRIEYRLKANSKKNSDIYIPPKGNLRELMKEPNGLIADKWNLYYSGVGEGKSSDIKFDPRGDNSYRLKFTNVRDKYYDFRLVDASTGTFKYGDSDNDFVFVEAASQNGPNIDLKDYFIVTDREDDTSASSILQYDSFDSSNQRLVFEDLAEGTKAVTYTNTTAIAGVIGQATLNVEGTPYNVYVAANGSLAIDQNGDGSVNSGETKLVIKGGGIVDLGSSNVISGDILTVNLTTLAKNIEDKTADETIYTKITKTGSTFDLDVPDQAALALEAKGDDYKGKTNYGVYYYMKNLLGANELKITYPITQGSAEVVLGEE